MPDIATALDRLRPAARYRGALTADSEEAYDVLDWQDDRSKPDWSEIAAIRAEPDPEPELSARQFRWMLGYYEIERAWAALRDENAPGKAGRSRALYANLLGNEAAGSYRFEETLALLAQVRTRPALVATGVDLSDDAVRRYWRHAAVQTFASLVEVVPEPVEDVSAPEGGGS